MKNTHFIFSFLCLIFLSSVMSKAQDFVHPGILHKESDFARMRQKVAEKAEPWYSTWTNLLASPEAQLGWAGPRAVTTVIRGGTGDNISLLYRDVAAAYENALIYKISGDKAHGDKAVQILNAWSLINKSVSGNSDRFLALGLDGYQFANAAELMRGYPGFEFERFKKYMEDVFYTMNDSFLTNHNDACSTNYRVNWDICNMNSMMAIGILCDNKDYFNKALNYAKSGDGNGNITRAVNFIHSPIWGQWEESGRDQGHAVGGLGLYGLFCEIAWNQGVDMYSYDDSRFRKGAEYVARYNIMTDSSGVSVGKYNDLPYNTYSRRMGTNCAWYTESTLGASVRGKYGSVWEAIYCHYANRLNQNDKVASIAEILQQQPSTIWPSVAIHADTYDTPGGAGLTLRTDPSSSVLPWLNMDICPRSIALLPNYGQTSLVDSILTVKGSGTGIKGTSDFCQFTFQRLYDDGSIVVKMSSLDEVNAFCQSGLMMRETLEQNSSNLFLSMSAAQGAVFSSRELAGGATSIVASNKNIKNVPCWLRISRVGNLFTASVSSDNVNWVAIGSKTLNLSRSLYVGMAVSSNTQNAVCTAVFDRAKITQANMRSVVKISLPETGTAFISPANVTISGTFRDMDGTLGKAEIYVNGNLVKTTYESPFSCNLSGVANGSYSAYVKAYDIQGAVQVSDTVTYTVNVKTTKLPWYKFDETQAVTNASDASGNNVTATLYGGPVFTTGKINKGIRLDGVDDHVKLPNGAIEQLSDFSVSTWVNPDSLPTWSRIFDFGSSTTSYMMLTGSDNNGKMQFSLVTDSRGSQSVASTTALPTKTWSLVTVTLSGDVLKLYLNSTLVGSSSTFTLRPYDLVATTSNYIGKSQWPDPYFKGSIDDFKLYNYALSSSEIATLAAQTATPPAIVANLSGSILTFDELNTTGSFTVSGLNLTSNIAITAPTGITVNPTSIASSASNATVTVTYNGTTTPINGNIVLTSGSTTQNVAVSALTNATCFTPLYSTGNIITDPICNSYTTDGWGAKGINSNPAYVYCGDKSGMIAGGSYDRVLTGVMKTNTKYRVKAKVWKVSGTVGIGVYGWNGTAGDIYKEVTTAGSWQDVDFTFVTGATLRSGGQGVFFNSGTGYIDNWEMYEVPRSIPSSSSLTYSGAGTKKVAVTGSKLTSAISITAPTGITVSPATLPANVTGDSVAITFDGINTTNSYVYLISGATKDSIQIAATAYPAITTSLDSLKFGELNTPVSITVNGRNLANDITITTPAGITANATTIPAGCASNVTATFTYDGTTPLTGNVTFTSGSTVKNVAASAVAHALCYTPLYPTGNKLADPYLNSLATYAGWGAKSINTDPTYVFCGTKDGKITGRCGGSIDYNLTGKIQGNRTYRVKAMVSTNGTGTVKIGISGATATNITKPISTAVGQWLPIDFTFTTKSSITTANMYFNSCETQTATVGYIDNWEMYEVPKVQVSSTSLSYLGAGTKKVAITAINLGNDISISAPDGFSVSPSILSSTVAGDSIYIKYDGLATKNGYVYLTSGSVKDSIQLTATALPAMTTNVSSLAFDELNTAGSFTVSGTDMLSNITISAPTGITVSPATIAAGTVSNVAVSVTWNGTTPATGNIALTCGSIVKNVPVAAFANSSCFTPLYPIGNKIADPYLNSLTTFGGWGAKSINTDPAYDYCGSRSGKITGVSAGSIDIAFPALKSNTHYRMKAMVLTYGGTFRIGMNNLGSGVANIDRVFDTDGVWQAFDIDFTTGSGATATSAWFNNAQLTGATGYIDNWEFYEVPKVLVSSSSLNYDRPETKQVTVTAINLVNPIAITAPTGFTVSPSTLSSTVVASPISITFDGLAARSNYVYLTSGNVKDSVLVTGTIDPIITTNLSSLAFDELNPTGSLTVSGANIASNITITAPAGITVSPATIPAGTVSNVAVSITYNGTTPVSGNIALTCGSTVKNVAVAAATNSSCFTPLYPSGNKIADPYLNSLTTFGGWGAKSINTDPAYVYCGTRSGKITGLGAGSIDIAFPALKSNAHYRMRAMVLTIGGTFRIGMNNLGSGVANIDRTFNTNGAWQAVDIDFTTGSGATSTLAWFNNVQLTGTTGYIDNWEFYEVPDITVSTSSLSYLGAGTKKAAVTAINLANAISITAPSGFSVSPSTLSQTVAGDSIAIAFDGLATKSGYVYLTSGAVIDSILVTGTALPVLTTSVASMSFNDLNTTGTFTVNGANLTSDIAISAPAGITVNPTTIAAGSASNVTVSITYDGTTLPLTGDIALTSSGLVRNVAVSSCFTPLYATGNLIPDPKMNSLAGFTQKWGRTSIVTGSEVYCGASCGKITGTGICWPNGGSIATPNITWAANTTCRVRAMVKTVSGSFAIGLTNTYPVGKTTANYIILVSTNNTWKQIDTTFTTGASATTGLAFFNNCEGATGFVGYIDNWEIYNLGVLRSAIQTTEFRNDSSTRTVKIYKGAANQITVYCSDLICTEGLITVSNAVGQALVTLQTSGTTTVINTSFKPGIYIVTLTVDGEKMTKKIVIS